MLDELTQKARGKEELSPGELQTALAQLIDASIGLEPKVEFLSALHERGETPKEIAELARILRGLAADPKVDIKLLGGLVLDTCGTGGDRSNTFNASTASSFILASAGIPVAKHGNRSISSQAGSADVVEALGIPIDLPPETVQPSLEETHFAFLFAPAYHKVFKTLQPIRQKLAENGSRSVFNLLGPLLNPVQPNVQIVGVYNSKLTEIICNVLKELGLLRAVAVHGFVDSSHESGLDEFSNCGPNRLSQLHSSGHVETIDLDISVVGLKASYLHDLKGGDKNKNAEIITGILKGEIKGAPREFVLFNASAGFVLSNLATDLKDGIAKAAAEIDSGRAWKKLEQVREFGRKHAGTHKPTRIKVDTAWLKLEREKQKRHTAIVTSPISPDEKKEE